MVARHWRGWTKPEHADDYEEHLRSRVLPGLKSLTGYQGGYVLRHNRPDEVEFLVVNFFESLAAVKRFAGGDYTTPVFEPEAKRLLCRIENFATHYEVRVKSI
jgi:heme-degrading monooxygenase HmoA